MFGCYIRISLLYVRVLYTYLHAIYTERVSVFILYICYKYRSLYIVCRYIIQPIAFGVSFLHSQISIENLVL